MSPTLTALCGFAGWTIILVFVLANYRVSLAMRGERAQRLTRAHLNCLEFLPVLAAISLAAVGTDKLSITDPLAMVVLWARVAQSIVHIASVSIPAVLVRATLFVVQLGIALYWIYGIMSA